MNTQTILENELDYQAGSSSFSILIAPLIQEYHQNVPACLKPYSPEGVAIGGTNNYLFLNEHFQDIVTAFSENPEYGVIAALLVISLIYYKHYTDFIGFTDTHYSK